MWWKLLLFGIIHPMIKQKAYKFFTDYLLGWCLLIIAPVLFIIVTVLGIIWGTVGYVIFAIQHRKMHHIWNIFRDLNHMALQVAYCIDKAGNVTSAPFLNNFLQSKNPRLGVPLKDIKFTDFILYALHGHSDHPISFIHGLRIIAKIFLTSAGHLFTRIINFFEKEHFIKSVRSYYTKNRQSVEVLGRKHNVFTPKQ